MKFTTEAIRQTLLGIDELVSKEYLHTNRHALLTTDPRGTERIGRLVGVSLKAEFGYSEPITDPADTGVTKTGALRSWKVKDDLNLQDHEGTSAYLTVAKMYESRGGTIEDGLFPAYVRASWEGSWFRDLVHAVHPFLCGDSTAGTSVLRLARELAAALALNHPIEERLKELLNSLGNLIPWFGDLPGVTAVLFAFFLVKTSTTGFCVWAEDDGGLILLRIGTRT
jgi:hypothetical protein